MGIIISEMFLSGFQNSRSPGRNARVAVQVGGERHNNLPSGVLSVDNVVAFDYFVDPPGLVDPEDHWLQFHWRTLELVGARQRALVCGSAGTGGTNPGGELPNTTDSQHPQWGVDAVRPNNTFAHSEPWYDFAGVAVRFPPQAPLRMTMYDQPIGSAFDGANYAWNYAQDPIYAGVSAQRAIVQSHFMTYLLLMSNTAGRLASDPRRRPVYQIEWTATMRVFNLQQPFPSVPEQFRALPWNGDPATINRCTATAPRYECIQACRYLPSRLPATFEAILLRDFPWCIL